jgi:hypothetical protein
LGITALDDLAEVHDHNRVAHMSDGGEVVRDEKIGQTQLGLEVPQEVQDLRSDRYVEGGYRLVQHDQLGRKR